MNPIYLVKASWPAGVAALFFGIVYSVLLCSFPDYIENFDEMLKYTHNSNWGGLEMLFILNSGILGATSVVISERRTDASGIMLWLIASSWCLISIGFGFAMAQTYLGNFPDPMWEILAFSLATAVGATALRTYLGGNL